MAEKFTKGELVACESYADNGALSHYNFVDENGDIIGFFCDEDAQIKNRMKREKAYANLFAAAPEMYRVLQGICFEKSARICEYAPESCKVCAISKALKKARGEE